MQLEVLSRWPYRQINVEGLFGRRNFPLELDPQLTIVTGENGSGKSTVLRAIDSLSRGRWATFHGLPLSGLELIFHDGTSLKGCNVEDRVIVTGGGEPWEIDLAEPEIADPRRRRDIIMMRRELETGQLSAAEAVTVEERIQFLTAGGIKRPDWVAGVLGGIEPKLISARRLEHRLRPEPSRHGDDAPISVVDGFALAIRDRMRIDLSRYAAESQRQEKSLPSRIVHAMQERTNEKTEEIAREVDDLRAEVRQLAELLARVGLFDEEDPDQQFEGYPRDDRSILVAVREVYRVARDRLSRLSGLRADLDLFSTFLNDRFTNKRIELNPESGIAVVLPDRETIKPSQLSSGEQQLLALAYELLFGTQARAVVLLDEPELSLHVAWLKGLISAFMDIGSLRELQFVIATHSPSIVAGFLDRERSLDLL